MSSSPVLGFLSFWDTNIRKARSLLLAHRTLRLSLFFQPFVFVFRLDNAYGLSVSSFFPLLSPLISSLVAHKWFLWGPFPRFSLSSNFPVLSGSLRLSSGTPARKIKCIYPILPLTLCNCSCIGGQMTRQRKEAKTVRLPLLWPQSLQSERKVPSSQILDTCTLSCTNCLH